MDSSKRRFHTAVVFCLLIILVVPAWMLASKASGQSSPTPSCAQALRFRDFFTDGDDAGWTQINRAWRVADGRYILDGGYLPGADGRDGFAVTHVGDQSWCNYLMSATFDNSNHSGSPSDAHDGMFYVRVQSPPPRGTYYRIDVWPFGTPDPRTGHGTLPGGLVQLTKVVNGSRVDYFDREYSNSVAGTNAITIRVTGPTIWVRVNGKPVLSWTDPDPILFGGIGLGAIWETDNWFDNVLVDRVVDQTTASQ